MKTTPFLALLSATLLAVPALCFAQDRDYNDYVLKAIQSMPAGGTYAKYQKSLPSSQRFNDLYQTVEDLGNALSPGLQGALKVDAKKAKNYSFCSSATYLAFCEAVSELQKKGLVEKSRALAGEMANVGDKNDVIHGKLDGIGIFGHWNADGPGTAVLFERLGLGMNFTSYAKAKPGDFMKIWWNENIGKGESGHLVVYLGESQDGKSVNMWSSQTKNDNGSAGYGTMWVEKSRIKRVVFSRLENPQNLKNWLSFSEAQKKSDYLIRIRQTGSSGAEMKKVTGSID